MKDNKIENIKKAPKLKMIATSSGVIFYTVFEIVKNGVIQEKIKLEGVI
jgi:hypothetical protein